MRDDLTQTVWEQSAKLPVWSSTLLFRSLEGNHGYGSWIANPVS